MKRYLNKYLRLFYPFVCYRLVKGTVYRQNIAIIPPPPNFHVILPTITKYTTKLDRKIPQKTTEQYIWG